MISKKRGNKARREESAADFQQSRGRASWLLYILKAADAAENALILTAALLILLVSLYSFLDNLRLYESAADDTLMNYRPAPEAPIRPEQKITDGQVAWLSVDGTAIDCPVMQGTDNFEYLNKDPSGEFRLSGSVFLDYRNDAGFRDEYSVLYGHHMEHGAMFGALDDFADDSFFRKHRSGTLAVTEAVYQIRLFAVCDTTGTDPILFSPGEYSRAEVTARIADSAFIFEEPPSDGSIVALSTCSGDGSDERLMVFGSIREMTGSG